MAIFKALFIVLVGAILHKSAGSALGGSGAYCENLSIIGGQPVSIEQVPYMVALEESEVTEVPNGNYETVCGGSIVSEKFILTAASCVKYRTSPLRVLVATDKLSTGGYYMDVEKPICHEDFDPQNNNNDICLLKLWFELPVKTGHNVAKIVLPRTDDEIGLVNVTGWGLNSAGNRGLVNNLRRVSIPVVSKECCEKMYDGNRLYDSKICAGAHGRDACQGDSGGPLTYNSGKGDVQIGIASYGEGCGVKPGVYTKVVDYIEWIDNVIAKNL